MNTNELVMLESTLDTVGVEMIGAIDDFELKEKFYAFQEDLQRKLVEKFPDVDFCFEAKQF